MTAIAATPSFAYPARITPADRLGLTVCLAILLHAIVILGVAFERQPRVTPKFETLDIVLVQTRTEEAPKEAEFLAQANHLGGGDHHETVRPTTPLPAPLPSAQAVVASTPLPSPALEPAPKPENKPPARVEAPAAKPIQELVVETAVAERAVTKPVKKPEKRAEKAVEAAPKPTPPEEAPVQTKQPADDAVAEMAAPPPSAASLVARSFAIASLDAEIQNQLDAKAKRPRRKFISANTREHKYAAYMEAWRAKVERVGNLNYPDEARRQRLNGNLILDVALNADGSINEINVRRPSGHPMLDDAAIRIVRLASPYAPFPDEFVKDVDILHITRTWQFMNSSQFAASR